MGDRIDISPWLMALMDKYKPNRTTQLLNHHPFCILPEKDKVIVLDVCHQNLLCDIRSRKEHNFCGLRTINISA